MSVRVRFAPSPTGYLHVGGLRTALYNYLFAKKMGGQCILRIEDTDRTRFVENAQENLIESLAWAGIEFDESPVKPGEYGPYIQSERFDMYREHAQKLIDNGWAYYAFDSSEDLEAMRERLQKEKKDPKYVRQEMHNSETLGMEEALKLIEAGEKHVVRLKVPQDAEIKFNDIIRGEVTVMGKDVDDQILLKSDGFPTYHLANVVDDYSMKITHVIRGEEWLPSTPKHVLLYDAFGWPRPDFAHLPLLLNQKKQKLSKRHGSVAVEDFRQQGYIKDAFVNFIALLGWNPTADREIYTFQELIDFFNLEKVNKGGAVFDYKKLEWIQGQYLRQETNEALLETLKPILEEKNITGFDDEFLLKVIELFKERITFINELPDMATYLFGPIPSFDEKFMKKQWKEGTTEVMTKVVEMLSNHDDYSHDSLHDTVKAYAEANELKIGKIMNPLRLMLTGTGSGASMFDTIALLGKEESVKRMNEFMAKKESGEL